LAGGIRIDRNDAVISFAIPGNATIVLTSGEINGQYWRAATDSDPVVLAPNLLTGQVFEQQLDCRRTCLTRDAFERISQATILLKSAL